jgi:prepilin-type processing-associated H-X9-DG protein
MLIEILVVIGVIGLLLGLALPGVQRVRGAAARAACLTNLREVGLSLHQYEQNRGSLPPNFVTFPPPNGRAIGASVSWRVALLPFLDQVAVWDRTVRCARVDPISYHNPPHDPMTLVIRPFVCPADSRLQQPLHDTISGVTAGYTSYLGVAGRYAGPNGMRDHTQFYGVFAPGRLGTRLAEIADGTSNTLAVGERPPPLSLEDGWWYSYMCDPRELGGKCRGPAAAMLVDNELPGNVGGCSGRYYFGPGRLDNTCDRLHFWSLHSGGANFLFADGSGRFISYSARSIMPALATRAGRESVTVPE